MQPWLGGFMLYLRGVRSNAEFGVLPCNKSPLEKSPVEKHLPSLYRWWLESLLGRLLEEMCKLPRRIAFVAKQLCDTPGIAVVCPEELELLGLREQYLV
jgi:hypothetical protein